MKIDDVSISNLQRTEMNLFIWPAFICYVKKKGLKNRQKQWYHNLQRVDISLTKLGTVIEDGLEWALFWCG
jgi:hypothetical protein